jgi:hypothetical protein
VAAVRTRAVEQDLFVVTASAGEQGLGVQCRMPLHGGLEVDAGAVVAAREGRGSVQQAVHGPGASDEVPLD